MAADRAVGIGFSCGLLADLVVNSPFGLNTLVLVLVGWGAGALAPQLVETHEIPAFFDGRFNGVIWSSALRLRSMAYRLQLRC